MKRSLLLTSLLIATMGLTSCGRKDPQIDASETGAIALTADMTCVAIKAKDKGQLSAATFIDEKKSTVIEKNEEAADYAQRIYAKAMDTEDKAEVKLLSPVFKNEDEKIKAFKAKNDIIVAQVGSTDGEMIEMFLYKPNAKDTTATYNSYAAMFSKKTDCIPAVKPDAKPRTAEVIKADITKNKADTVAKQTEFDGIKIPTDAELAKAIDKKTQLVLDYPALKKALDDATDDAAKAKAKKELDANVKATEEQQAIIGAKDKKEALGLEIEKLKAELLKLEAELAKLSDEEEEK